MWLCYLTIPADLGDDRLAGPPDPAPYWRNCLPCHRDGNPYSCPVRIFDRHGCWAPNVPERDLKRVLGRFDGHVPGD